MSGESYARSKKFRKSDASLAIKIHAEENASLDDYAAILREANSIFNQCSRAVTTARRGGNVQKVDGILVVRDFKTGSVEALCDAYFAGIVSGVVANVVCQLFVYVMRRINGRRNKDSRTPLEAVDENVIAAAKLTEAINKAVANTTNDRSSLKAKVESLTLTITVTYKGVAHEVTEPD